MRRTPSLESLFVAVFVLLGFRVGILPISDNSMLTHLRTGMDMVRGAGIPRVDPYSFSAAGTEWVVQSWLPEWTYGWAERFGGFRLVVLEQAFLFALLAWLLARLARAGSPLRTALSVGVVVGIAIPFWTPRPLLFGLLCMTLTVSIVERRRTPWLLLPVVWLWVNSHGSYPLGLLWLASRAVGERLDWRTWPRETLRYSWAFVASLAASVVNPLGAKLLLFPFTLGEKRSVFENVVEWKSPDFHQTGNQIALVFLAVALVLLFRARLTWRDCVPTMVFLVLSLVAVRNLPVLAIVVAPVMARIMRGPEGRSPRPAPTERQLRMNRALTVTIGAAFVVFGVAGLAAEPLDLTSYPFRSAAYLERNLLLSEPHRIAHQDIVGNYLTLRFGKRARVFIDDRVDMYPVRVSRDYLSLLRGKPGSVELLDRYRVDVVVWDKGLPLPQLLQSSGRWRQMFPEGDWVVLRRYP